MASPRRSVCIVADKYFQKGGAEIFFDKFYELSGAQARFLSSDASSLSFWHWPVRVILSKIYQFNLLLFQMVLFVFYTSVWQKFVRFLDSLKAKYSAILVNVTFLYPLDKVADNAWYYYHIFPDWVFWRAPSRIPGFLRVLIDWLVNIFAVGYRQKIFNGLQGRKIIVNSTASAALFLKFWGKQSKIFFPILDKPAEKARVRAKSNTRTCAFAYVGRLDKSKSVEDLVRLWCKLRVCAYVIGDGPLYQNIARLIHSYACQVRLTGFVLKPKVREYLSQVKYVVSITPEAFGLLFLDALDSGAMPVGLVHSGLYDITKNTKTSIILNAYTPAQAVKQLENWIDARLSDKNEGGGLQDAIEPLALLYNHYDMRNLLRLVKTHNEQG